MVASGAAWSKTLSRRGAKARLKHDTLESYLENLGLEDLDMVGILKGDFEVLKKRVQRGISFCREYCIDWKRSASDAAFATGSECNCVLALAKGKKYSDVVKKLKLSEERSSMYGFQASIPFSDDSDPLWSLEHAVLTRIWQLAAAYVG